MSSTLIDPTNIPADLGNLPSERGMSVSFPSEGDSEEIQALLDGEARETDDGGMEIIPASVGGLDEDEAQNPRLVQPHNANLALYLSPAELSAIGSLVWESTAEDFNSNEEFIESLRDGLDVLGLKKKRLDTPYKNAPGMEHPMILEAAIRFNSNAMAEMLPPNGPVKEKIVGDAGQQQSTLEQSAARQQKYLNIHLTKYDNGFRSDYDQGLFMLGLLGTIFRKVARDPIDRLVKSRFRTPFNLIVAYNSTDMNYRYTEVDLVSPSDVRRHQLSKYWRDVELGLPSNADGEEAETNQRLKEPGREQSGRTEDAQHCIYTQYALLDLDPLRHVGEDGEPTGLPLPYAVTIDRDSREVLRIERNWSAKDEHCLPIRRYSVYRYMPGLGFYGIGLVQLLSSSQDAATVMLRQALVSFSLASFPGGFISKQIKVDQGNLSIGPMEWKPIDTGGLPIGNMVFPLPYKDVPPSFSPLYEAITTGGERLGSIAEMNVGESNQNAAVGTTLALIEQAVKVESAVIRRLHSSMADELAMISALFGEDPEARYPYLVDGQENVALGSDFASPDNITPVSDPNVPTQLQRITQAQTRLQLAQSSGGIIDVRVAYEEFLRAMGTEESLAKRLMPQAPQGKPSDPVSEFAFALKGMPLAAGPDQSHQAHIAAHIAQMQVPNLPPPVMTAILSHTADHLSLFYRAQVQAMTGIAVQIGQQLPPEQENQISAQIAAVTGQIMQQIAPLMGAAGGNDPAKMESLRLQAEKLKFDREKHQSDIEDSHRKAEQAGRQDQGELIREKAQLADNAADRSIQEQQMALDRERIELERDKMMLDAQTKIHTELVKAHTTRHVASSKPNPKEPSGIGK